MHRAGRTKEVTAELAGRLVSCGYLERRARSQRPARHAVSYSVPSITNTARRTPMADQPDTEHGNTAYWDNYYAGTRDTGRRLPSQFAAFVAGELPEPHRLIDFGCGTGRDSVFFATHGHHVVAVDGSSSAIERGVALADQQGEKVQFINAPVDDLGVVNIIPVTDGPTAVYGRFFLHAITDEQEGAFLRCAESLTREGDIMAVEYRTVRDQSQTKETPDHFRRFVEPAQFQYAAAQRGFRVRYAVEGFGFAKYKHDDAYVARCILERV